MGGLKIEEVPKWRNLKLQGLLYSLATAEKWSIFGGGFDLEVVAKCGSTVVWYMNSNSVVVQGYYILKACFCLFPLPDRMFTHILACMNNW